MKLSIGFSPCPNDTFIFDALVNKKIDTGGLEFEPVLEDVETLNRWALEGKLDITKLSFPAFFQSLDNYVLLPSGSALGKGVGPLLVARDPVFDKDYVTQHQQELSFALPGLHTTAHLLFNFAFPGAVNKEYMVFSEIEDAVASGKTDLGIIIHENRFTFSQKGLQQVMDLGSYWEEKMNAPVPLGGIAINQAIKRSTALQAGKLVRRSLEYALSRYPEITDYVKEHAQTLSENVMRQHIELYVNNYSLELGDDGREAIRLLHETFLTLHGMEKDEEGSVLFL